MHMSVKADDCNIACIIKIGRFFPRRWQLCYARNKQLIEIEWWIVSHANEPLSAMLFKHTHTHTNSLAHSHNSLFPLVLFLAFCCFAMLLVSYCFEALLASAKAFFSSASDKTMPSLLWQIITVMMRWHFLPRMSLKPYPKHTVHSHTYNRPCSMRVYSYAYHTRGTHDDIDVIVTEAPRL